MALIDQLPGGNALTGGMPGGMSSLTRRPPQTEFDASSVFAPQSKLPRGTVQGQVHAPAVPLQSVPGRGQPSPGAGGAGSIGGLLGALMRARGRGAGSAMLGG